MSANARSLLYYYDFDQIENGGLVYGGINRGSSSVELTGKFKSGDKIPYSTSGAFGSSGAYKAASTQNSLWLGDGSASLGCGTEKGFTMSFWMKTQASHAAGTNPFGFRLAGIDYRFEYTTDNDGSFTIYYNDSSDAHAVAETIQITETGVWKHYALVFRPNCGTTAGLGTCTIYIDGQAAGSMTVVAAGNLQQLHIGTWVRKNGSDRANQYSNSELDEVAVYDYPATAENVKWLARNKPAPGVVAMRAMPVMWPFDESSDNGTHKYYPSWTTGVYPGNAGTGTDSSYRWKGQYWTEYGSPGALGTDKSFALYEAKIADSETFRVNGASATEGLGANLLDGAAVSFWIKAPKYLGHNWQRVLSLQIGSNKAGRFEWDSEDPAIKLYGSPTSASGRTVLKDGEWTHVCLNWNKGISAFEFYVDGVNTNVQWSLANPTAADVFKSFAVGTTAVYWDNNNGISPQNVFVDEPAIFNHSLSDGQIAWLAGHIPEVTPLDTTNLVRTVSGNATWGKDGGAAWTVRQWNEEGGAWSDSQLALCYPTMEDVEVETTVSLASNAAIANDTVVTAKKVSFLNATEDATVSAAIKNSEGSIFDPQTLEIGDGVELTVPIYALDKAGTIVFGSDSKMVFDVSNYYVGGTTNALSAGALVFPEGETAEDILSHFGVSDDRFDVSLSPDGKSVFVVPSAAVSMWTGAAGDGRMNTPGNWFSGLVPGAGASVYFPAASGEIVNDIDSFTPADIVFGAGIADGLEISGDAMSGLHAVTNRSSSVKPVVSAAVSFAEGVDADILTASGEGNFVKWTGGMTAYNLKKAASNATVFLSGEVTITKDIGDWSRYVNVDYFVVTDSGTKLTIPNSVVFSTDANFEIKEGAAIAIGGDLVSRCSAFAYEIAGTLEISGWAEKDNASSDVRFAVNNSSGYLKAYGLKEAAPGQNRDIVLTSSNNISFQSHWVIGAGGVAGGTSLMMHDNDSGNGDFVTHIYASDDFTINGSVSVGWSQKSNSRWPYLYVHTEDVEGTTPRTVTMDATVTGNTQHSRIRVCGSGTFFDKSGESLPRGVEVYDSVTYSLLPGKTAGNVFKLLNAGCTLKVPSSGNATVKSAEISGNTKLEFHFTERLIAPCIVFSGTPTIGNGITVSATTDVLLPPVIEIKITSGANITDLSKFTLDAETAKWATLSLSADKDLVLTRKPYFIIKVR